MKKKENALQGSDLRLCSIFLLLGIALTLFANGVIESHSAEGAWLVRVFGIGAIGWSTIPFLAAAGAKVLESFERRRSGANRNSSGPNP